MAEFWEYDARLMRRWNTDPLAHAGQSLYEAFYSNPIAFADPLGLKPEGGPGKKQDNDNAAETSIYCSDCGPEPTDKSSQQYTPPKRLNGWQRFWNKLNGKGYLNNANDFFADRTNFYRETTIRSAPSYEGKGFVVYYVTAIKVTEIQVDGEKRFEYYEKSEKVHFDNPWTSQYDKVDPNLEYTPEGIYEKDNWLIFNNQVAGTISIDPTSVGPGKIKQIRNFIKFAKEFKGIFGALKKGANSTLNAEKIVIQFGKTENQIHHAFRHTDKLGLERSLVRSSIENHFKTIHTKVIKGKPLNQVIEIEGKKIQYSVYQLPDGTFNIGRIHGIE